MPAADAVVAGATSSAAASFIAGAIEAAALAQGAIAIAIASAEGGGAFAGVRQVDPRFWKLSRATDRWAVKDEAATVGGARDYGAKL
jgi:hypothetical protein